MDSYLIKGGTKLDGIVEIESAKNSVLPIIAASILTTEEVIIKKCPKIQDVLSMVKILNHIGVKTRFSDDNLIINSITLNGCSIPESLTGEMRSSVFMLGALLGRCKKCEISLPGGCNIGERPIDIHINALKKMKVNIQNDSCKITANCDKIKNSKIYLPYPSVGATENIILASVLGEGRTTIINAAKEPEIVDLSNFLKKIGAKIYGAGKDTVYVEGVNKLHGGEYKPISDRIEAGTFLIAGAITGGNIAVKNADAKNIFPLLNKLCDNTCKIDINNDIIYLKGGNRRRGFVVETAPYPAFPTDLQAQIMALSTVSSGISLIHETVFETRFNHVEELKKMGADISVKDNVALIKGVEKLCGTEVNAHDLRGGASLVLAGLSACDETLVKNIRHIERGYLNFDKKLRNLNADIKIVR